jgi:RNA-directed DNA polymerase
MIDLSALYEPPLVYAYIDVLPRHATHCLKCMREHVKVYEIMTNGGKKRRKIYAPGPELSWVQNRIRHGLLTQIEVEDCVHGFVRGRGTVSNAHIHAHRRCQWVMNMDLKNFFPSINTGRVFGLFKTLFCFNDKVAGHLARLTTYDNHLCQGFCTSPDLANFVAWKLDRRLMGLAKKLDIGYSRYADDLTFSSTSWRPRAEAVCNMVRRIVYDEGFRVNEDKIAIMGIGRRQIVTGLVVSEHGISLPRRTRRLLRAAVHHWRQQSPERRTSILGWVSYLNAVDPVLAQRLLDAIAMAETDGARTWTNAVPSHPFSQDIGR